MPKQKADLKPDFGGWATKNNIKCTDGRTILPDAFAKQDGVTVPLVWQHMHNEPANVLGHALLQNRPEGVYTYGFLNDTKAGKNAKILVEHKDIESLSIYANSLVEKSKSVAHGVIQEVSLVLSRANPGAQIDYINIQHANGEVSELEDEAIIHMGLTLELPGDEVEELEEDLEKLVEEVLSHANDDDMKTVGDVIATMTDEQRDAMYVVMTQIMEGGELEQSAIEESDSDDEDEGDNKNLMKKNVFDGSGVEVMKRPKLAHSDFVNIMNDARRIGSLKAAFEESEAGAEFLAHVGTYGVGADRTELEYLFPDARSITKEPTWISRPMEWVAGVLKEARHTPFSRIKSLHADITADEARARGYVTGNLKVEEVFPVLRRITTPHTIYKKQKLDRDDIVDITDFDIVRWLKAEMRVMLDEEIARAVLVGDGRDPVVDVDDHIPMDNVRPVWGDDAVYTYHKQVAVDRTDDELVDDVITARTEYRGSGNPTMFVAPSQLTAWLILRDTDGRRLYRTVAELASEMRVKKIVEVPVFEGLNRTPVATQYNLRAIILNLRDYTIGADKGGEINFFEDFDIDYNQQKYLIETRISGALWVPKSAIVLEQANA